MTTKQARASSVQRVCAACAGFVCPVPATQVLPRIIVQSYDSLFFCVSLTLKLQQMMLPLTLGSVLGTEWVTGYAHAYRSELCMPACYCSGTAMPRGQGTDKAYDMIPPPPRPSTPKVRKTTVRRAHVLRQACACARCAVPKEGMPTKTCPYLTPTTIVATGHYDTMCRQISAHWGKWLFSWGSATHHQKLHATLPIPTSKLHVKGEELPWCPSVFCTFQ